MNLFQAFIDFFLHIDKNLALIIANFGVFSYLFIFIVIFMETGFVVTPFLPGDSLLFVAGALSATGSFNIIALWILLCLAAILGDTVNFWVGRFIGPKVFNPNFKSRIFKKEYLDKAQSFYEKHGGKAIVLARFVPIVRTFAPFVAGVGKMHYGRFISFNIFGGILWVSLFLLGGYFLGGLPFIQNNFHYLVVIIILISLVPIAIEFINSKKK